MSAENDFVAAWKAYDTRRPLTGERLMIQSVRRDGSDYDPVSLAICVDPGVYPGFQFIDLSQHSGGGIWFGSDPMHWFPLMPPQPNQPCLLNNQMKDDGTSSGPVVAVAPMRMAYVDPVYVTLSAAGNLPDYYESIPGENLDLEMKNVGDPEYPEYLAARSAYLNRRSTAISELYARLSAICDTLNAGDYVGSLQTIAEAMWEAVNAGETSPHVASVTQQINNFPNRDNELTAYAWSNSPNISGNFYSVQTFNGIADWTDNENKIEHFTWTGSSAWLATSVSPLYRAVKYGVVFNCAARQPESVRAAIFDICLYVTGIDATLDPSKYTFFLSNKIYVPDDDAYTTAERLHDIEEGNRGDIVSIEAYPRIRTRTTIGGASQYITPILFRVRFEQFEFTTSDDLGLFSIGVVTAPDKQFAVDNNDYTIPRSAYYWRNLDPEKTQRGFEVSKYPRIFPLYGDNNDANIVVEEEGG